MSYDEVPHESPSLPGLLGQIHRIADDKFVDVLDQRKIQLLRQKARLKSQMKPG